MQALSCQGGIHILPHAPPSSCQELHCLLADATLQLPRWMLLGKQLTQGAWALFFVIHSLLQRGVTCKVADGCVCIGFHYWEMFCHGLISLF